MNMKNTKSNFKEKFMQDFYRDLLDFINSFSAYETYFQGVLTQLAANICSSNSLYINYFKDKNEKKRISIIFLKENYNTWMIIEEGISYEDFMDKIQITEETIDLTKLENSKKVNQGTFIDSDNKDFPLLKEAFKIINDDYVKSRLSNLNH